MSPLQTLIVGCPSDVFEASETSQTFTATLLENSGEVTLYTFLNPTSTVSTCVVTSNSIIDLYVDDALEIGVIGFHSGCTVQPCSVISSSQVDSPKVIRFKIQTTFQGANTLTSSEITVTILDQCTVVTLVPTPSQPVTVSQTVGIRENQTPVFNLPIFTDLSTEHCAVLTYEAYLSDESGQQTLLSVSQDGSRVYLDATQPYTIQTIDFKVKISFTGGQSVFVNTIYSLIVQCDG